jgi:hypothetical protein
MAEETTMLLNEVMKVSRTIGVRRFLGRASLLLGLAVFSGCSAGAEAEPVQQDEQALTNCQGASCDGILPGDSSCKLDMQDTLRGAQVFDAQGKAIGGIGLFRSPSCQTVWASSSFYVAGGARNFRICTVRKRATDNDPSCHDYQGTYGDGPMKYVPSGKSAFGKVTVDGVTTRTPDYTVP